MRGGKIKLDHYNAISVLKERESNQFLDLP